MKIKAILIAAASVAILTGGFAFVNSKAHFICHHKWSEADCFEPATCSICNKTKGEKLEHQFAPADCENPEICTLCGSQRGVPLPHDWIPASCEEPEICSLCGKTNGEPLGHKWNDASCLEAKTCEVCGKTEGEPKGHVWRSADCKSPKTCVICGETVGETKEHTWKDADCENPKTCTVCGTTEGEPKGHTWKDADCENPRTCTVCGKTEGSPRGHSWQPATYSSPERCSVCGKTNGSTLYEDTSIPSIILTDSFPKEVKLYNNDKWNAYPPQVSTIRIDSASYSYIGEDTGSYYYNITISGQKIADTVSDTEPADVYVMGLLYRVMQRFDGPKYYTSCIFGEAGLSDEARNNTKISSICTGDSFTLTFRVSHAKLLSGPESQYYFVFRSIDDDILENDIRQQVEGS